MTVRTPPWGSIIVATSGLALTMQFLDRPLAQYFATHAGWLFQVAAFLTRFGDALWWLLPSLLLFLAARFLWRSPTWAARALFVFLSVAVSGVAVDLIKLIARRARPQLWFTQGIYGFSYPHVQAPYQSFPSGHAACVSGAVLALSLLMPRYRPVLLAVGFMLALTRVVVTAHYLSDVVAAALLATLIVPALWRAFARHGLELRGSAWSGGMRSSATAARLIGVEPALRPARLLHRPPPQVAAANRYRARVQV